MKDNILKRVNLQILRIATIESGEKEKLISMLENVMEKPGD